MKINIIFISLIIYMFYMNEVNGLQFKDCDCQKVSSALLREECENGNDPEIVNFKPHDTDPKKCILKGFKFNCELPINISHLHGFERSRSKTGKFTSVTVSDCNTELQECILKRNTTSSIIIDMTLSEDVTSIDTVVHGKIMGVEMPFNMPNPDACVDSGLHCPLEKGESYTYTATLPILRVYPKVIVEVKWELRDQNGDNIICILIPAKIQ